jgi:hypothetical protein
LIQGLGKKEKRKSEILEKKEEKNKKAVNTLDTRSASI